jgi:hypothetical protein
MSWSPNLEAFVKLIQTSPRCQMGSIRGRLIIQQFLVGMLLLTVAGLIPVVGGLVLLVVNLFGFGSVLLSQWTMRKPRHPEVRMTQPVGLLDQSVDQQQQTH